MLNKLNCLLKTLDEKSQEEPLVLAFVALGALFVLCFSVLAVVVVVKFLGILLIPAISVIWSVVMVIIDYRREKGE